MTNIIYFLLVAILFLPFVLIIKAKKIKINTKVIVMIGLTVAMTYILSSIKIFRLPQGGTISLASYVPIMLLAYIYGPEIGIIAGFAFGILNLTIDPYIVHPLQMLLDYPLSGMALGIFGYFKDKKKTGMIIGIVIVGIIKFIFHFLSGVIFFGEYAGEENVFIYSFVYNILYVSIETLIAIVIMSILPLERIKNSINK